MKRTVAVMAIMIGTISVASAAKKETNRDPAAANEGFTFAACKPAYNIYSDDEAYKNNCAVPLQSTKVRAGGLDPGMISVPGCDARHHMVVSSQPINTRCLPPGVVEL